MLRNISINKFSQKYIRFQDKFNKIYFNHPHIGDEDLRKNSALVGHFFDNSIKHLKNSES